MALPTRGQRDWDDELNDEMQRLDGDVQSAKSDASSARSTAISAKSSADAARSAAENAEVAAGSAADYAANAAAAAQTAASATGDAVTAAADRAEVAAAQAVAPTDEKVASVVADENSQARGALNNAFGGGVRGPGDRKYRLIAGALRHNGTDWDVIDDTGHRPAGVDDVYVYQGKVRVLFSSLAASKVVGFVAGCDETLAKNGFAVGASVGLTFADLTITQTPPEYADYVYYNGSSWASLNGVFTPTFASGTLALTHSPIPAPLSPDKNYALMNASATVRGGGCIAALESSQSATDTGVIRLRFYDYAGTLLTTPTTDMKVFVRHGGGSPQVRDAATVTTTTYPDSNIWFVATVEAD